MKKATALIFVVLGATAICAGCTVVTDPHPVAYAEVDVVPANIETYPTTVYEGRPVYYYSDHWYYRTGNRWNHYRQEPPVLERHRRYVQQAPPAPRGGAYAPPARRE